MTKEEFFELAKNINTYKIKKRLTGDLHYAKKGDTFLSDTLYERGYNINQLILDGFLEIVPRIFEFEKMIVGKNVHTIFTVCPQCFNHGVNLPLDKICGNCGFTETMTYYDAETINNLLIELLNSEQKDERIVATKMPNEQDAG